jgi:hypothetical protein
MMWLKGRYESRSTLGREWMIWKYYLGKSSKNSNNEERLPLINLREAVSFRDRMWLIVAMRLQGQHPPFHLRTSSNTPSIPTNVAHGSFHIFREGMRFPSCNFCLKMRLGEPTPFKTKLQFGRAQQLVRTNPRLNFTPKEQGVMEKLARIVTGVFGARHSNVRVRRCYRSKISKGGFIKVTISLTKPMRMSDMIRCLSNGWKGWEGYHVIQRSSRCLQGYTHAIDESKV